MYEVRLHGAERFARDLEIFARRGVPYAVRNALNTAAFETRKLWVDEIDRKMILRNRYTTRTVRVVRATGTTLASMEARVGSPLDYMLDQEQGARRAKGGKHGVPIPTTSAAGQAMGSKPRTKVVRRPNRMGSITLADRRLASITDKKRRTAAAIRLAAKAGSKFAYLDTGGKARGIFRISGQRRPKIRMLWDLSRPTVTTPQNPTLKPSVSRIRTRVPMIYRDAIIEQLRRNKVFGY